jgi:uncharacterized membrane protein YfcA
VDNIVRLFLYLFTGILNREIFYLGLLLSPAVILGMIIGVKVDARMNETAVKNTVIALLIISGTTLLLKSILGR